MIKINPENFKKSMSKFTTGITIIAINKNDKYIGKTVNSFSSLSLKPPLVLFSLDKKSSSLNDYKKASFLTINILSSKQKDLSNYFSGKKPKWGDTKYNLNSDNVPIIKNCITNLSCNILDTLAKGDHLIFFCQVKEIFTDISKKPLIYFDSKYK